MRAAERGASIERERVQLSRALTVSFSAQRAELVRSLARDVALGEPRRPYRLTAAQWEPIVSRAVMVAERDQVDALTRAAARSLYAGADRFGSDVGAIVSFDVPDPRATAYLRTRGAELVTRISETTRTAMSNVLADAVQNELGLRNIEAALRDTFDLSRGRAELIARTETAAAYTEGGLVAARKLVHDGVATEKAWLVNEPDDEPCIENGRSAFIPVDDPFPSGDQRPPVHPNCECDLVFRAV